MPTLSETDLIPFHVSPPVGERIIVLAPHADDETLGMGGSLRILSTCGKKIKVVVLTRGEKAETDTRKQQKHAEIRQKEAVKAFKILGVSDYDFLEFPDRALIAHKEEAEEAIENIINDFAPDVLYSPSMVEFHPDHRAAAELSLSLCKRNSQVRCIFYEVGVPLRPSFFVDITRVFKHKRRAIKCYKSQIRITDYLRLAKALNAYRSFTLGEGVTFAEAFWEIAENANEDYLKDWMMFKVALAGNRS